MITYANIALWGKHGEGKVTKVSLADLPGLPSTRLNVLKGTTNDYVQFSNGNQFRGGQSNVLHRYLMGLEPGDKREVDHINGDTLDNRRENLEIVSAGENRVRAFHRAKENKV